MKILAIEGSGSVAGVALLEDEHIVAEFYTDYRKTHSQTLMPLIDSMLSITETEKTSIDVIAVSRGPGSFTGLRIVAATAKGLAMGLDIPIVEVSTLEAFAYGHTESTEVICPMLDARRGQVFAAAYEFMEGQLINVFGEKLLSAVDLAQSLKALKRKVIFLGDGADVNKSDIENVLGENAVFASATTKRQRASYVAVLGALRYKAGKSISAFDFLPNYLKETEYDKSKAIRKI